MKLSIILAYFYYNIFPIYFLSVILLWVMADDQTPHQIHVIYSHDLVLNNIWSSKAQQILIY